MQEERGGWWHEGERVREYKNERWGGFYNVCKKLDEVQEGKGVGVVE